MTITWDLPTTAPGPGVSAPGLAAAPFRLNRRRSDVENARAACWPPGSALRRELLGVVGGYLGAGGAW